MSYEWFVSLRYLRAKRKQTFISVISFISIAGVTLGVAALILVLAVMTGFHDGVRQQILGNVPHVLIQKYGGDIASYEEVVESAAQRFTAHRRGYAFRLEGSDASVAAQCGRGQRQGDSPGEQDLPSGFSDGGKPAGRRASLPSR